MTKRLWRREAKKTKDQNGREIDRNGRQIKYASYMQEMMFKNQPRTYPLLDVLFKRAGMTYTLSNKQQETLRGMIEKIRTEKEAEKESTNEAQ